MNHNKTITAATETLVSGLCDNLVTVAKMLKSDDGENKEYDRALVELTGNFLGKSNEELPGIARQIGIDPTHLWD